MKNFQQIENELFTIENFVDGVNEVLLQVTKDKVTFDEIQQELLKYLKGESNIDQFSFEFAMIIRGVRKDERRFLYDEFQDNN